MEHFTLLIAIVSVSLTTIVLANNENKPEPYLPGTPVIPGEFPHSVFFKYVNISIPQYGGAIISPRYILTRGFAINRNISFEVMVGCAEFNSSYCIPFQVSETFLHPNYNGSATLHNIGIVVLTQDIIFNTFAQPIPLSSKHIEAGTSLNITGMDQGDLNMKWLQVISKTDSNCTEANPDGGPIFCIEHSMFVGDGIRGFPVEFVGHLVGIAAAWTSDYYLILRVEPYLGFIYGVIQGKNPL